MKIFKSATSKLELRVVRTNEDLVRFNIGTAHEAFASIDISPESIPALALAELEAAGVEAKMSPFDRAGTQEQLEAIADGLVGYIEANKASTAEAKEQAELEAEAREFAKVWEPDYGDKWEGFGEMSRNRWLAVARRAREMRKEK